MGWGGGGGERGSRREPSRVARSISAAPAPPAPWRRTHRAAATAFICASAESRHSRRSTTMSNWKNALASVGMSFSCMSATNWNGSNCASMAAICFTARPCSVSAIRLSTMYDALTTSLRGHVRACGAGGQPASGSRGHGHITHTSTTVDGGTARCEGCSTNPASLAHRRTGLAGVPVPSCVLVVPARAAAAARLTGAATSPTPPARPRSCRPRAP